VTVTAFGYHINILSHREKEPIAIWRMFIPEQADGKAGEQSYSPAVPHPHNQSVAALIAFRLIECHRPPRTWSGD
jgi:hypothetical protein